MNEAKSALGTAIFSACGQYRYLLVRRLRERTSPERERVATFIMLNPSTADATHNDPTIRKCIGFARRWHYDTLQVLNLFAIRATLPREMKRAADPIGSDNLRWFAHALADRPAENHLVICAWGVHGTHLAQDRVVLHWLHQQGIVPQTLGLTRNGHPRHPLYVAYSTDLVETAL